MKLIDTLNEALGVPLGIIETANEIYNKILSGKFNYIITDERDEEMDTPNVIKDTFKIGDEVYKEIVYNILVEPHPEADKIVLGGLSIKSSFRMDGVKAIKNKSDVLTLMFNFYCPGDDGEPTISDKDIRDGIKKYFTNKKHFMVSKITHELKHGYDNTKGKYDNLLAVAKYQNSSIYVNFPITPIAKFCFSIYFVSLAETLVRPSEIAALIESKRITKKDFLSFLKSDETYIHLNKIKNMTYKKFYWDLYNYIDDIEYYLNMKGYEDIEQMDMSEVVDLFLTDIRENLQKNTMSMMISMVFGNLSPLQVMMTKSQEPMKFMLKVQKNIFKYKNNEDFFSKEIEYNAKEADVVIKKLAKLYAMAK